MVFVIQGPFSSDVTNFFGLQSYLLEDDLEKTTGRIAIDDEMTIQGLIYHLQKASNLCSNLTFDGLLIMNRILRNLRPVRFSPI